MSSVSFEVRRDDLRDCRLVEGPEITPEPGEVVLRVDRFALTANNVTYAVAGESMSYWNFFPAEGGWGRIPVWGFADVAESRCDGIREGERFYGYYPMSTHLLVRPEAVKPSSFIDAMPNRAPLPAAYNQYRAVAHDRAYTAEGEAAQMILQPLFTTSFLIDDFLADNDFFGARRVVLASASSKTAYGLAFLLARRQGCEVVGLTSRANAAFVGMGE